MERFNYLHPIIYANTSRAKPRNESFKYLMKCSFAKSKMYSQAVLKSCVILTVFAAIKSWKKKQRNLFKRTVQTHSTVISRDKVKWNGVFLIQFCTESCLPPRDRLNPPYNDKWILKHATLHTFYSCNSPTYTLKHTFTILRHHQFHFYPVYYFKIIINYNHETLHKKFKINE